MSLGPRAWMLTVVAAAASATIVLSGHQAQQAAQIAALPTTAQAATAQKTYTGAPMNIDVRGADLRDFLRGFAETNNLNLVLDPAVKGTVDIKLTNVPWDQALDIILKNYKLGYVIDGSIIRIAPLDVLAQEAADRQKLADAQAPAAVELRTYTLSYAQAANVEPLLKSAVLSKFGDTKVDDRTNTLIVRDLPDRLDAAADLIKTLDRPQPQVEIEAQVIETDHDSARALGIQWGLNGRMTQELGNTSNLKFPNNGTISGATGTTQTPNDPRATALDATGTAVNLPVTAPTSGVGISLGSINNAFGIDVAISALQHSGKGKILSTPRVTTQNNQPAEVMQGTQIPIQTVANNTVVVQFKDAALSLKVTPQITAANTVIMKIELENAAADFSREVNNIPPINTQRAVTQVQVSDGATTVIGGVVVTTEQSTTDRTPGVSHIPLLGWLFKRDTAQDQTRELLIFITPRILRSQP